MFWNYRVVNLKSMNGGENWYAVCEVFYDEETKKPEGFTTFQLGGETVNELEDVLQMIDKAFTLPVLEESDFPQEDEEGDSPFDKRGFNDFTKFMEYVTNNPLKPLKPF